MKHLNPPSLLAITTATLLLSGCILGPELKEEPCTELITVENPIPDTTVAVGDTLLIDLVKPPVFISSGGRSISYQTSVRQREKRVHVNLIPNSNDNERLTKLTIRGESVGKVMGELMASSGCRENSTTFNIAITE